MKFVDLHNIMLKTKKSLSKRLKITISGKILKRKQGQNHLNAKANSSKRLNKKRKMEIDIKNKDLAKFLP